LPLAGTAFLSVNDRDKEALLPVARQLVESGFTLVATAGTADSLERRGLAVERVRKVAEGRPHVVDMMLNGDIDLIVNTPLGGESFLDDREIRTTALKLDIPCITTLSGAMAAVEGIRSLEADRLDVTALQDLTAKFPPLPEQQTLGAAAFREEI
jgi:carbamoyl-phosphate synthase large subunit